MNSLIDALLRCVPDPQVLDQILVRNPMSLYGFE